MDGENNGLNPIQMDDLGGKPTIFGNILMLHTMRYVFFRQVVVFLATFLQRPYSSNHDMVEAKYLWYICIPDAQNMVYLHTFAWFLMTVRCR